jgi:hypothetical protein
LDALRFRPCPPTLQEAQVGSHRQPAIGLKTLPGQLNQLTNIPERRRGPSHPINR